MAIHLSRYWGVYYRAMGRLSHLERADLNVGEQHRIDALERVHRAVQQAAASVDEAELYVLVRADGRVPWHCASWLLERAWASGVRNLALGAMDSEGAYAVVPVSTVKTEDDTVPNGAVRMRLVRLGSGREAFTRVRLPAEDAFDLPRNGDGEREAAPESAAGAAFQRVREALRVAVGKYGRRHWQVAAPVIGFHPRHWQGPNREYRGGKVCVADVAIILQMLGDLGVEHVDVVAGDIPGRVAPGPSPVRPWER